MIVFILNIVDHIVYLSYSPDINFSPFPLFPLFFPGGLSDKDPKAASNEVTPKIKGISGALQRFGEVLPKVTKLIKLQKAAAAKGIEIKRKSDTPEVLKELSFA